MGSLYQPGRRTPKDDNKPRRRSGGYSAVPRGRQYQVDCYLGLISIDKVKDGGREEFDEDLEQLRDSNVPEEEIELFSRFGNLESGTAVWFGWLLRQENRAFRVNLTRATEEELDAFRDAMLRAVEEARPEVRRRDEEAKRAEEQGFFSLHRVTRSAPQVVDFGRKKSEYNQKLSVGREGFHTVAPPEGTESSESVAEVDREGTT